MNSNESECVTRPHVLANPLDSNIPMTAAGYGRLVNRIEALTSDAGAVKHLIPRLVTSKPFAEDVAGRMPMAFCAFRPLVKNILTMRQLLQDIDAAFSMGFKLTGGVSHQIPNGRWEYRAFGHDGDPKLREAPVEVRFVTIDDETDKRSKCSSTAVKQCLSEGTVFLNDAPSFWPHIAELCAEVAKASRFPASCNIYITAPASQCSNPVHSDHHDVVILQAQGAKRWRVYWPPKHVPNRDAFSRGKGGDIIRDSELSLALDVTLHAGDVLYIPAGFPHLTDTRGAPQGSFKSSVHLTVHWSAHAWYLDYMNLRNALLIKAGLDEEIDEGLLPYEALWGHPGLYDIVWHKPSTSWTELWPSLLCRVERAQPDHWDKMHLRRVAESLLRQVTLYRERLLQLSSDIASDEIFGFGTRSHAVEVTNRKIACINGMGELKEALLAWVNRSDDDTTLSTDGVE